MVWPRYVLKILLAGTIGAILFMLVTRGQLSARAEFCYYEAQSYWACMRGYR